MTLATFIENPTGQIKFVTNNAERIVITGTGTVGIGIAAPNVPLAQLHVKGAPYAIFGQGTSGIGVYGTSQSNDGVFGSSNATGVYGSSQDGIGVIGTSVNGTGISGKSTNEIGVVGHGKIYNFDAQGPGLPYHSTSSLRWKKIFEIYQIP